MRRSLDVVAPAFRDMAHSIVWCTVATVTPTGNPNTRVLHPIWEWDGDRLQGCTTSWLTSDVERRAGWDRFANGPDPVGYDPSIIPPWTSPEAAAFGVLHLEPTWLRVQPGTLMTGGSGELLTWSA